MLISSGYIMWLLKDAVSLAVIHRILHKKRYFHLHEFHHRWSKNTNTLNTNFAFDVVDVLLENGSGIALLIPLKYLLFGDYSFNLLSYVVVIWIDHSLHSANPYSGAFLNPVLDTIFRANVRLNSH